MPIAIFFNFGRGSIKKTTNIQDGKSCKAAPLGRLRGGGREEACGLLGGQSASDYYIVPNGEYAQSVGHEIPRYYEYDVLVIAPHGIYHIENKDWGGTLEGDDNCWFVNSADRKNPLKSAHYKTKVLRTLLQSQNPAWGRAAVNTLVSLSRPGQSKFGLDPNSECFKLTYLLDERLIDRLTDCYWIKKSPNHIADIQADIVDFLTGESSRAGHERTQILGMKVVEVLQENEDFREYLCVSSGSLGKRYKVREYPLDRQDFDAAKLKKLKDKAQNALKAQEELAMSQYIITAECFPDDEGAFFYMKSVYMDECSLRSTMKRRTLTQAEKMKVVADVAHALVVAHKAGVYHGAVSPENIFFVPDGHAALANFTFAYFDAHSGKMGYTVSTLLMSELGNSPYMAPEVNDDDSMAASDIYSLGVVAYEMLVGKLPFDCQLVFQTRYGGVLPASLLPSALVPDLPKWVDTLISKSVVEDVDKRWPSAQDMIDFIEDNMRPAPVATTRVADLKSVYVPASNVINLKDLKPGDQVTNDLCLYEEIGKGGFGRVFKAKHQTNDEFLAIKIFDRGTTTDEAKAEYEALRSLNHDHIVHYQYNGISNQGLYFTLMELLEGDNLGIYMTGSLRLLEGEVYAMACQLLSALVYMHGQGKPLFHRDIKPENIICDKRRGYVLIDFNIASDADDQAFAGTLPYMAPDLINSARRIEWDASADTFALGVTIYELLAHAYPWPGGKNLPQMIKQPTDVREYNDRISDSFADFAMRSIKPRRNERFATAQSMLDALNAIGPEGVLRKREKAAAAKNGLPMPIVDYLNSLYSQSRYGNSGTRTATTPGATAELDALTYIPTRLDSALQPDILALKYRLVIITGNAGDGKTAFIRQIERRGDGLKPLHSNNGAEFRIKGVRFESNYDGSQDEDAKANDEVLERFFSPFVGLTDYNKAAEGRVIAINEGRLVDFLSQHRGLEALRDNIEDYFFEEGRVELLPGLMVINLNKRSVTASAEGGSLLARQVKRLTDRKLWGGCDNCPVASKCFIKYNVDTFADSAAGGEVIGRLEWLIRTIVYRRELHITMRDLRSLLAFMITRDCSCLDVKKLIKDVEAAGRPDVYWQYYYFNVTSDACPKVTFDMPPLQSADRLVRLLRETDVASVAIPPLDRDLFYKPKVADGYLAFAERGASLLDAFNDAKRDAEAGRMKIGPAEVSEIQKSFARHHYFEGKDSDGVSSFKRRLPYRHVTAFHKALTANAADPGILRGLARAISASEGCAADCLTDDYLLLADSHVKDPISKSYRRFPLSEFELVVGASPSLDRYVEAENDSLIFRHKTDAFIRLTISLDLFEMLKYIQGGFNPSLNDLRGRFIELQIFKNLLESKAYSEILVTRDHRKFNVISMDDAKRLIVKPLEVVADKGAMNKKA